MPLADTFDVTPFGEHAPLVLFYLKHVDDVHNLDVQIGDKAAKGADFMNELKEKYPEAAKMAEDITATLTNIEDEAERAVAIYFLTRNREFTRIPTDYIAKNQPQEEAKPQDEAVNAELWAKRGAAQKQAAIMFQGLKLAEFGEDLLATLPPCPEGKKGVAPGQKRGPQGRHLPSPISWTVTTTSDDGTTVTEDHGKQTGAQIAKICGVKSSDIRLAVEKAYPDATPNEFEITIKNKTLKGIVGDTPTEDTDDSDDDLGEVEFDD